ncbi:hypothetical protein C8J56DRAFT_900869 [Mycena floridula]|nr:hypothetical protein C8J56DRAFT_900869 [Mycena floridula]
MTSGTLAYRLGLPLLRMPGNYPKVGLPAKIVSARVTLSSTIPEHRREWGRAVFSHHPTPHIYLAMSLTGIRVVQNRNQVQYLKKFHSSPRQHGLQRPPLDNGRERRDQYPVSQPPFTPGSGSTAPSTVASGYGWRDSWKSWWFDWVTFQVGGWKSCEADPKRISLAPPVKWGARRRVGRGDGAPGLLACARLVSLDRIRIQVSIPNFRNRS